MAAKDLDLHFDLAAAALQLLLALPHAPPAATAAADPSTPAPPPAAPPAALHASPASGAEWVTGAGGGGGGVGVGVGGVPGGVAAPALSELLRMLGALLCTFCLSANLPPGVAGSHSLGGVVARRLGAVTRHRLLPSALRLVRRAAAAAGPVARHVPANAALCATAALSWSLGAASRRESTRPRQT